MSLKCIILFLCISFSTLLYQVEAGEILDKIKGGLNTAYDGVHCGLHKLKELVKHHEHDVDPCSGKPSATTARPREVVGFTENTQIYNDGGRSRENAPSYGWRV